jgi:transcriptional regulator with XRE-family HTH domain
MMSLGTNIKKIREQKGLLQKQVASELAMGYTNYNKMENGIREPSVVELQKLARLFNMTVDQILNMDTDIPNDITLEDKSGIEQMFLIKQLDEDDRTVVFKIIVTMLTKKKFKDFFQENVATL